MRAHEFLPVVAVAALLAFASPGAGQTEETRSRFRFASTHFGLDVLGMPTGAGSVLMANAADPRGVEVPVQGVTRLTIGGLHFWGHADFYVAIPVYSTQGSVDAPAGVDVGHDVGVEVGARAFAWPLGSRRATPFAGIAITSGKYRQAQAEIAGPKLDYRRPALQAGLVWMNRFGSLEAGIQYTPSAGLDYPLSRVRSTTIELPAIGAWVGFKRHTDATLGNERRRAGGELVQAERRLAERGALSGFTMQAGMTTAFTASRSTHNTENRSYLGSRLPPASGPDLGFGYYLNDIDAAINVSFRRFVQRQSGFGVEQKSRRTAVGLEAIKFVGDYHGFVPFLGASLGIDAATFEEREGGAEVANIRQTTWRPGIVAGWDIRPTRTNWFVLRTNLRYTPGSGIETATDRHMATDHIEVDFIQLVVYPERLVAGR